MRARSRNPCDAGGPYVHAHVANAAPAWQNCVQFVASISHALCTLCLKIGSYLSALSVIASLQDFDCAHITANDRYHQRSFGGAREVQH